MNIEELVNYVLSQLRSGVNPNDIVVQLRNANWPEEAINSAFDQARAQLAPTITPTEPYSDQNQAINTDSQPSQQTPAIVPSSTGRGKIMTGWKIFKQCFGIIKHNPELWRYMVMSMVLNIGILFLSFAIIAIDSVTTTILSKQSNGDMMFEVLGVIFCVVTMYISTAVTYFYATALSIHVLSVFKGEQITYKDCVSKARKKLPAILSYALISTVIGYILSFIEEKFKFIGFIISKVLGLLWSLAVTFTLPLIADSDTNGVSSIKKSISLFKETWGETISSRVYVGGFIFLIYFLIMIPATIFIGFVLYSIMGIISILISIGIFFLGIIILATANTLASNVLNVALYYYVKYKVVPPSFSADLLSSALIAKRK